MKTIERDGAMGFVVNKSEIAALTAYASNDKTRYNLNVVAFDTGDQRIMATDGHRLTTCQAMTLTAWDVPKRVVMVPRDCMIDVGGRLKGKGEEAIFLFALNTVIVSTPMGDATYKLVDGVFPPVDQVIPKHTHTASCGVFGFNAFYVADIALIGKACEAKSPIIRLQLGPDAVSPALMKVHSASRDCEWTIVLMPARLTGSLK